jgi:type IV pilus assembly protein PilV
MLIIRSQRGVSMIEVLVAIMILTVGLLGAAGMQSRLQVAEVEAYQRAQAIVLLQDMVDRISSNRSKAAIEEYVTGTTNALGKDTDTDGTGDYAESAPAGCTAAPTTAVTVAQRDKCEWEAAIMGAAEKKAGANLGAMNGALGCITNPVTTMPREVEVAIVWQGLSPIRVPTNTTCGSGAFGTDDKYRRALVVKIKIGCLQNDITTGACTTL